MKAIRFDLNLVPDQQGHTVDVNRNVYTQTSIDERQRAVEALASELVINPPGGLIGGPQQRLPTALAQHQMQSADQMDTNNATDTENAAVCPTAAISPTVSAISCSKPA